MDCLTHFLVALQSALIGAILAKLLVSCEGLLLSCWVRMKLQPAGLRSNSIAMRSRRYSTGRYPKTV